LVWAWVVDACAKTIIPVAPKLRQEYRTMKGSTSFNSPSSSNQSTCFTIVGMDLMIDDELNPWIIEINHLPSFRQTEMDYRMKKALVTDSLRLLDVQVG
ncbi:unnamed protein product, partial [Choristocarpus tenellus]